MSARVFYPSERPDFREFYDDERSTTPSASTFIATSERAVGFADRMRCGRQAYKELYNEPRGLFTETARFFVGRMFDPDDRLKL